MISARERALASNRSPVAGSGRPHDVETPDVHTASEEYRRRFEGGGRVALLRQNAGVSRALRIAAPHSISVLDVGGGHGQLSEVLLASGHRVVVHGSSPVCFAAATERGAVAAPRIVSPLWNLPFAANSFDLVAGVRLMAHVSRWRELLDEMTRVSRRFVLVDFPLLGGVQRLSGVFFGMKKKVERNTRPFFLFRRHDVLEHLAASGLRPVLWFGELVLPLALHRLLRTPRLSAAAEDALSAIGLGERIGSPVLLLAQKTTNGSPVRRRDGSRGDIV
jgi:SAM-dependent methyltransferase